MSEEEQLVLTAAEWEDICARSAVDEFVSRMDEPSIMEFMRKAKHAKPLDPTGRIS